MKAVLVIDMPKNCDDCPLLDTTDIVHRGGDYAYCWAMEKAFKNRSKDEFIFVKKPKGCPLKPLPKKKEVEVNEIEDLISAEFTVEDFYNDKYIAKIRLATDKMIALGWNACLKEIEDGER